MLFFDFSDNKTRLVILLTSAWLRTFNFNDFKHLGKETKTTFGFQNDLTD